MQFRIIGTSFDVGDMEVELIYSVNPKILHENLEGEVIAINLDSGIYFSLNKSASEIWSIVCEGTSLQFIVQFLKSIYTNQSDIISNEVQRLLDEAMSEGLIHARLAVANDDPDLNIIQPQLTEFISPVMEKYTEMQNMLLLDPIHDVDEETGWPHLG